MIKLQKRIPTRARATPWPFLFSVVEGQLIKNLPPAPPSKPRVRLQPQGKKQLRAGP